MSILVLLDSDSRTTVCPPTGQRPEAATSEAPLSQNTEHVLQGRARLIAQYKDKPRIEALVCVYLDQIQLIEDTFFDLAFERSISNAQGVQLDGIGDIVGQERQGLNDTDYRPLVRARVKANNSEGTAPDVTAVAVAALDNVGTPRFDVQFPAAFILEFTDPFGFDEAIMNDLIQDAGAGGVRAVITLPLQAANEANVFSAAADFPSFSTTQGLDSSATPGTGTGKLSRAMDEQTG